MISEYKYRQINEGLERDLVKNKVLLEAWKSVTYNTNKNGKPFKILSKNISGATIQKKIYADRSYEKELVVCIKSTIGYVSDTFNLYVPFDYASKDYVSKPQNVNDDGIYILDLEDVRNRVLGKIKYFEEQINLIEKALADLKEMCEFCDDTYNMLKRTAGTQSGFTLMSEYMKYLLL